MSTNPWISPCRVSFPSAPPAAPSAEPRASGAQRARTRHDHPPRRPHSGTSPPLQTAKRSGKEHLRNTKQRGAQVKNPDR